MSLIISERGKRRQGRRWLLALELVVAVNAIGGGVYGLSGAKDVPRQWLDGSPFHSYLIPSLVLLVVVGGSALLAAALLAVQAREGPTAALLVALILLSWLAVEVAIIPFSWLQPTFFAIAIATAVLARRLRRQSRRSALISHAGRAR